MAIQFLNKALNESIAVAFIMPITAIKYSIQRQVNKYAKLIYQEILPIDSFELPNKTPYKCPSCFQIWTLQETNYKDLREQKPQTNHNDFTCYRHNATKQSQKYIDYDWDFAVYCQGRKDYKKIFTKQDYQFLFDRIKKTSDQFYFFKAKDQKSLNNLLSINWQELAYTNHITPGFCKNNIVKKYIELCRM